MVRIRLLHPPPEEIGPILGDVVHNLRSALDYATCSLVEFGHDSVDLSRTQFPFGEQDRELTTKEKKGASLGDIAPHALIMIEEARRCGGFALQLLKILSNQDKHRLLLATVARQFPIRMQIDVATNSADFVPDENGIDVWFRNLTDGIVIPMPQILSIKLGIEVEGQEAPFVIHTIDHVNNAVGLALRLMATAVDLPDPPNEGHSSHGAKSERP
ncbi:hypothetical protein RSM1_09080 [Methylobacterium radiotolerans]|nr:hypothetical protein RSM1_09080 [Methylobacterium radiotolerans]